MHLGVVLTFTLAFVVVSSTRINNNEDSNFENDINNNIYDNNNDDGLRFYPQYILLNKALGIADAHAWNQNNPDSCNQASFDEIFSFFPNKGNPKRRLGVSNQITVLDNTENGNYLKFLTNLLNLCVKNDFPVAVGLDPFQFWSSRPDLWNWFDSSSPGYNPANIKNVEWSSFNSVNATTIAWRDWGSQFRVPPHPNLASPDVLAAYVQALKPAATLVGNWYKSLPPNQKYLLAYVKVTWEVEIGLNFYYYKNGNDYRTKNPKDDPTVGISGAQQLGYNAVCTSTRRCSGDITVDQLDIIVNNYFSLMASTMISAGIPRSKLITHSGANFGNFPAGVAWNSPICGVIPEAHPGYSFYTYAYDPKSGKGIDNALDKIDGTPWGAPEWLYMGGNSGTPRDQWIQAFNNSLNYRNSRLVDIFNFEHVKTVPEAVGAAQDVIANSPNCLVEPIHEFTVKNISQNSVQFQWTIGGDSDKMYLDVSSKPTLLPSGALAEPDILNHVDVTSKPSYVLDPPAKFIGKTLYASIISVGCGGNQKVICDTLTFTA